MLIYLIKKIGSFLLILLLLSFITVVIIYHAPGSAFVDLSYWHAYLTFYQQLLVKQSVGLDYSLWEIVTHILLPTFELAVLAIIFAIVIGFPVAILSGLRDNSTKLNYLIKLICFILYASPIIWVTVLVIVALSDNWLFIKVNAYQPTINSRSIIEILLSPNVDKLTTLYNEIKLLLIPVLILTIQPCIITIQQISQQVSITNRQNFIKVARIRENSASKIIFRHLLPNALPNAVPQLTYNITTLLFSTMTIEILFNRSGLGTWVFSAYQQHDYLVIALAFLSCGVFISLLTLLSQIMLILVYPIQSRILYE